MKFTLENATRFGWRGLQGWAYNSAADFPRASAAYFEVTGKHGKVKSLSSDRVYYVIEGRGVFNIEGKEMPVHAGDAVIVPKETSYDYEAAEGILLRLFLVHCPAFNETDEVPLF